jgi:hypothetical protein
MTHRVKLLRTLALLSFGLISTSALGASTLCERLMVDGKLHAAIYEINIGGGDDEAPGVGDVIVIRDGDGSGSTYDPNKPELDIGGDKDKGDEQRRREMEIPYPEPALQIIVPEREEKKRDKLPAILPLIIPPKIDPAKKPPKPLPN